MAVDSEAPPSPSRLDRLGRWVLIGVVTAGVLAAVTMSDEAITVPENLGILALGGLFLLLMVVVGQRLERLVVRLQVCYFAAQLLVAGAIFSLQARLGAFGMAWLILMPLVVQAMLAWSWRGVALISGAILLLPVVHVYLLSGAGAAAEVAMGITAALVFVLLFSAVTARERRARARSDRLSIELVRANRRLVELYASADELASSRERNRLAREIHDTLGHALTVINVQLESARVLITDRPAEAERRIGRAARLAREGLEEVRRSVGALRSGPLDDQSLEDALRGLGEEARAAGVPTEVRIEGTTRRLPDEVSMTLYRTTQEGLTNVRKHAEAGRAWVRLDYRDPRRVVLVVQDDGRGMEPPEAAGFGLLGIRERVQALGGSTELEGPPGDGVTLSVEVPG